MNQFYRALHMPPKRLLRKVMGEKEIYTIAVRPRPTAEGTEPLPALEGGPYTLLPGREGWWFADPLLYHRRGKRWLFAEAMDLSTGKGRLEVCELHDDGTADGWRVALEEDFHLSFPMVFDWNGEVWMIPETGSDHSLRLYRCKTFPTQWELVQRFPTDEGLCDTILLDRRAEALTLLCSETRPDNQLYVRYRRYTLRHAVQETAAVPLPAEDTLPAAPGPFELLPDEAYNLQHRDFDLVSRNAGPFFLLGEQIIHPTQVSTTVDYGVYLQFLARRGSSEVPLCAATPQNVEITGLAPADIIGIHTYCRDDVLEIIDARYLTRIPKIEKPEVSTPSAEECRGRRPRRPAPLASLCETDSPDTGEVALAPEGERWPRRAGGREPRHNPKSSGQPSTSLPHRLRAEPPPRGGQGNFTPTMRYSHAHENHRHSAILPRAVGPEGPV